jgi:hypothetical protein
MSMPGASDLADIIVYALTYPEQHRHAVVPANKEVDIAYWNDKYCILVIAAPTFLPTDG